MTEISASAQGDAIIDPRFESVPNQLKDEQKDFSLQNEAWQLFNDLIPPRNR